MRAPLFFFLFFFFLNLQAQEFPGLKDIILDSGAYTQTHRYRAVGLSYQTTRDEALSPLRFGGPGISFSSTNWKQWDKWLFQSLFSSKFLLLQNGPASSTMTEMGFSYAFSALKELSPICHSRWRFSVGPEGSMFLNLRLHSRNVNNIATYDWATAVGISTLVSTKMKVWGRTFALSNQFKLPLLFLYARPPYAWGIPPGIFEEQEGAWKEAFRLGTFNHALSLTNQLNLDFHLSKRKKGKVIQYRAYRFSYNWNYFQVKTHNSIQTGGHTLSFCRALSF